ncbi:Cenpl [Columba livia]|nr:Cenpl [Columba livia]
MESAADGPAQPRPSTGRPSWGLPFGRARRRSALSPSSRLPPAPRRTQVKAGAAEVAEDTQRTAFLLRKQWTLYSVTPLYRFSEAHLRDYSRLLSAFVAAEKKKGLAVEIGGELDIKVSVTSLPDLKGSDRDQAAILVQLSSRSSASPKNSEEKVIWSGWFCCVGGDELSENLPEAFTCLPLFLVNGAESNTAIVGTWFQKTFDCCFRRLSLSPFNLSWMAAMWTGCKVDKPASATELVFSVPRLPHPLHISYAINLEDAQALWATIQKTPGEITQEEVDVFMDCLYSHFYRHFKIHLSATKLVKVSTAVASAHCDGIIKFRQSQYLTGVLMLLTELAICQIQ